MYRKFKEKLISWQNKNIKEPLMVIGARQVGKTYIIREFCEETYEDYIYCNFESSPELISVFEGSLKPYDILEQLSVLEERRLNEKTAIIFDEIQKCERAITSLKYFCEAKENYRIIAAGSLLGVKINRFEGSFPVGKVRIESMYPMDFEEFLLAAGEDVLCNAIQESFIKMTPLGEAIHNRALKLYKDYLFVGGMPASVNEYVRNGKSLVEFNKDVSKNILLAYQADMSKYTMGAAESAKIFETFESIPRQLAKENPKFKYKEIRPMANRRDFYSSIDWLKSSGIVIMVNNIEFVQSPLKAYYKTSDFRIYMGDVGLMTALSHVSYKSILTNEHNIYKGVLVENYTMQALSSAGIDAYYYKPDATIEIDALIELDGDIIPIEVKSGRHKRSTSLKNYNEKNHPKKMVRVSENNFGKVDNLYSIPLYAMYLINLL